MSAFAGFLILVLVCCAYLTPTLVCYCRHRENSGSVVVVNLFLGWTLIGWVVALAMACHTPAATVQHVHVHSPAVRRNGKATRYAGARRRHESWESHT